MSTTVVVVVREDCEGFHGQVAHVAIQGDGSPRHFEAAVKEALRQSGQNLPSVSRLAPQVSIAAPRQLTFA